MGRGKGVIGMKRTSFWKYVVLAALVCLGFGLNPAYVSLCQGAEWDPGPMPKEMRIASYDVGGGVYIITAALGEGIQKKFGVRLRSLPVGTGTSRILNVKIGNTDFGATIDGLFAEEGLYDFSGLDWGPQPLRMIYMSNRESAYSIAVAANSDIKTLADLKGKKAAWLVGSPFTQLMVTGALAFAGLSMNDVKLVETRSIGAMYETLIDGKADFSPMDSSSSTAYRLEGSPKGIRWISFPPEDKEGWDRFRKINPQVQPIQCKYGAGFSDKNPIWVATVPMPQYFVYDSADEKKVYWIVKMMAESYEQYKDIALGMPWHKLEDAVKAYSVLPYHPGAVRYFKEKGVWNAQLEKNQAELIDRQAKLGKLWKEAVDEALEKGIKDKDFSDFWLKKRESAFPNFWVESPVAK
jgi:uncharacterized protein